MQTLDENILVAESPGFGAEEAAEYAEIERHAEEPEAAEERGEDSTDDPVRVYLREMGSVRLLTRQAEVDLAQRMERGQFRMQKAISRSALVRQQALELYQSVENGETRLEDVVSVGGKDDAAKRRQSLDVIRRFKKLAETERELSILQQKLAAAANQ